VHAIIIFKQITKVYVLYKRFQSNSIKVMKDFYIEPKRYTEQN